MSPGWNMTAASLQSILFFSTENKLSHCVAPEFPLMFFPAFSPSSSSSECSCLFPSTFEPVRVLASAVDTFLFLSLHQCGYLHSEHNEKLKVLIVKYFTLFFLNMHR